MKIRDVCKSIYPENNFLALVYVNHCEEYQVVQKNSPGLTQELKNYLS